MSIRRCGIQARVLPFVITLGTLGSLGCWIGCADPAGTAPAPKTPITETNVAPTDTPEERKAAAEELDAGERQLAVAAGDCASACEALRHISHARTRLCVRASSPECLDATQRDRQASAQVASTCAPCDAP